MIPEGIQMKYIAENAKIHSRFKLKGNFADSWNGHDNFTFLIGYWFETSSVGTLKTLTAVNRYSLHLP